MSVSLSGCGVPISLNTGRVDDVVDTSSGCASSFCFASFASSSLSGLSYLEDDRRAVLFSFWIEIAMACGLFELRVHNREVK
jgi:hypothetical protein